MVTTHANRNALCLLAALVLLLSLIPTVQCTAMRNLDARIWGTNEQPAEDQPGEAPPIISLLASGLAALGFGGMTAWLRRVSNSSKKNLAGIESRVEDLERELEKMFDKNTDTPA